MTTSFASPMYSIISMMMKLVQVGQLQGHNVSSTKFTMKSIQPIPKERGMERLMSFECVFKSFFPTPYS